MREKKKTKHTSTMRCMFQVTWNVVWFGVTVGGWVNVGDADLYAAFKLKTICSLTNESI